MSYNFNKPESKELRQKLRNDMPKAELVLWKYLYNKQLNGFKFRRQHGVGPFILDFYCPKLKLAIEIDGDSHFEDGADKKDKKRQSYIEQFDIKFLRFTNLDIYNNIESVIEIIKREIDK